MLNNTVLLTNHALTGVWLGSIIESPLLGYPVGVISHLALDSTPHAAWDSNPFLTYKVKQPDIPGMPYFKEPRNFILGSLDFAGALTILAVGLVIFPHRRIQIAAGWLGAVSPDLLYLPEIFFQKRILPAFKSFHHRIQWSESPYGIPVEILWATLMLHLLHLV
jgi:hypothetical protein